MKARRLVIMARESEAGKDIAAVAEKTVMLSLTRQGAARPRPGLLNLVLVTLVCK